MEQCGGLIDAAQDTLVLVFELADKTVLKSPETIQKILDDPKVRKAIEAVALAEAKQLAEKQKKNKPVSSHDVKHSAKKIATTAGDAALSSAKRQIESSPEYRKLKDGIQKLECSFRHSTVGVFVDENKGWLILVASGLALGGATALYVLRTGDKISGEVAKLAGKHLRFKILGNVEIGTKEILFVPSKQAVGTKVFAAVKWQKVSAKVDIHVAFKEDQLTSTSARGEVVWKIAKGLKLNAHGQGGYQKPAEPWQQSWLYDLGVGISYAGGQGMSRLSLSALAFATQTPTQNKVGGKAEANLKLTDGSKKDPSSLSLKLGAQGSRTVTYQSTGVDKLQNEIAVTLGIVGRF